MFWLDARANDRVAIEVPTRLLKQGLVSLQYIRHGIESVVLSLHPPYRDSGQRRHPSNAANRTTAGRFPALASERLRLPTRHDPFLLLSCR